MSGTNYYGFTHGGTFNAANFQRPNPPQPPQPPQPPGPPTAYPVNYAPTAPGFGYPPAPPAPAGYATSYQPTGNTAAYPTGTSAPRVDNSGQQPAAAYTYTNVSQNSDTNRPVYATQVPQSGYSNHGSAGMGGTASNLSHGQQSAPSATTTSAGASTYSGYEAAVYAAATNFIQSKGLGTGGSTWVNPKRGGYSGGGGGASGGGYGGSGGGGGRGSFPKKNFNAHSAPKSAAQLLYCDICKISCAGSQTYREHLEGKNHKKKEAQMKTGAPQPAAKTKLSFRCDLCGVTCTGQDTYNAHVRGAKHQKTLKLHQTLNKPIPSTEPTVIQPTQGGGGLVKNLVSPTDPKKVVVVPKVNFIGGQKLTSTGVIETSASFDVQKEGSDSNVISGYEKEIEPVGEEYVESIRSDDGKLTSYFCKLCDCRFNDLSAKEMHTKGRRHRLQYKKKVNPNLEVEVKVGGNPKFRRLNDEKMRRDLMRMRQHDLWTMRAMYQSQMMTPPIGTPLQLFGRPPASNTGPKRETIEDRYIMLKHAAVYPTDDECNTTQKLVVFAEKGLKGVSDKLAEEARAAGVKTIDEDERLLKGVMRVGDLAKQLMLRGDLQVELVVLCSSLPTVDLLKKVAGMLPEYLSALTEDALDVSVAESEAAIVVANPNEPRIRVYIIFTSVAFREDFDSANKTDKSAVLDKKKCLAALASLRHAKWFQARCTNLQFCCVVLRILRDLRQRMGAWSHLPSWPTELLVEKVICSTSSPGSVSEVLRHVFEAVASGILLKSGPGLLDPCEKDVVDAAAGLDLQQREDITSSAQHFLRLISFGQLHKVLAMDKLTDSDVLGGLSGQQRKRPRESGFDVEITEEPPVGAYLKNTTPR